MPMSFLVMGSSKRRPIRRLMAKKVYSGLVTPWPLAGWPTRRSPCGVKATMDGVVRAPSAFSMTLGAEPSITATQELVVPRSMPITLAILSSSHWAWHPGPKRRPPVHPIEFFTKISHGPKPCLHMGVYRERLGDCQAVPGAWSLIRALRHSQLRGFQKSGRDAVAV